MGQTCLSNLGEKFKNEKCRASSTTQSVYEMLMLNKLPNCLNYLKTYFPLTYPYITIYRAT